MNVVISQSLNERICGGSSQSLRWAVRDISKYSCETLFNESSGDVNGREHLNNPALIRYAKVVSKSSALTRFELCHLMVLSFYSERDESSEVIAVVVSSRQRIPSLGSFPKLVRCDRRRQTQTIVINTHRALSVSDHVSF